MFSFVVTYILLADVAELADAPHSKCGGFDRAGSSPAIGTIFKLGLVLSKLFNLMRYIFGDARGAVFCLTRI